MNPFVIYFPQFYPIEVNDAAWGAGFTDWTLVGYANLLNRWQRRAPKRGFYDGASTSVHQAQVNEIRHHGIGGIGLYHYWFNTHQELGAFETTLRQSPEESTVPWFLIWASEGWSKRWLGDSTPLLTLNAEPSDGEIERHSDHLAECFSHEKYLRVEGRPVFVWYNLSHFRKPESVVERYRACLQNRDIDIFSGHFIKNPFEVAYSEFMEFSYLFEPRLYFGFQRRGRGGFARNVNAVLRRCFGEGFNEKLLVSIDRIQQSGTSFSASHFLSYFADERRSELVGRLQGKYQEVISPGWDNTPRYRNRYTRLESLPVADFARLIRESVSRPTALPPLINAWNEWSEGAAIEPCQYLGSTYLDSLSHILTSDAPCRNRTTA